jgi:hypothetical protein
VKARATIDKKMVKVAGRTTGELIGVQKVPRV